MSILRVQTSPISGAVVDLYAVPVVAVKVSCSSGFHADNLHRRQGLALAHALVAIGGDRQMDPHTFTRISGQEWRDDGLIVRMRKDGQQRAWLALTWDSRRQCAHDDQNPPHRAGFHSSHAQAPP